ncbi:MAG: hypothetical protein K2K96_12335, partial [Lachnospiraceae bacterium]|nr:hypothetical protein [Lachnospiraceae bacterium]
MIKELDSVKDFLEEEYRSYSRQLSEAEDLLKEQEKKIREQERFIAVLEKEKEKKSEFLSAYNNDDSVLHRIKEETEKKRQIEKDCLETRNKINELSDKTEKYRMALELISAVDQEDHLIVSGQFMRETEEVLNHIVNDYTKELKSFAKTVEEYMYMD